MDGALLVLDHVSELDDTLGGGLPLHALPALIVGEVDGVVGGCFHHVYQIWLDLKTIYSLAID